MARIKNISGDDRIVPLLGERLVLSGEVVEVDDDLSWAYTCQLDVWAPADDVAQSIHDAEVEKLEQAAADREAAEQEQEAALRAAMQQRFEPEPAPARNGSRDEWILWASQSSEAQPSLGTLLSLTRDEIRDQYGPVETPVTPTVTPTETPTETPVDNPDGDQNEAQGDPSEATDHDAVDTDGTKES